MRQNKVKFDGLLERIITLATKKGKVEAIKTDIPSSKGTEYSASCTWPNTDRNIEVFATKGVNGYSQIKTHINRTSPSKNLERSDINFSITNDKHGVDGNIGDRHGTLISSEKGDCEVMNSILHRTNLHLKTMEERLLAG